MPKDDRQLIGTYFDYTLTTNQAALTVTLPGGGRTIYWAGGRVQSDLCVAAAAALLPTVWHHGGGSYSEDGASPVVVPEDWDNVLQLFLDRGEALTTKALSKVVSNPARVVRRIAERFKHGAVRLPARKGDGYFVRVRPCPKR